MAIAVAEMAVAEMAVAEMAVAEMAVPSDVYSFIILTDYFSVGSVSKFIRDGFLFIYR
jgi:hypothetical protein